MRVKADAFLAEVLFADPTNERQERLTGRILAVTFSPQQLEAHLQKRLEESGLEPGDERLAHELAAQHAHNVNEGRRVAGGTVRVTAPADWVRHCLPYHNRGL